MSADLDRHRPERRHKPRAQRLRPVRAFGLGIALAAGCVNAGPPVTEPPAVDATGVTGVVDETATAQVDQRRYLEIRISGQPVGGVEATRTVLPDGRIHTTDRSRVSLERKNGDMVDRFVSETRSETTYAADLSFIEERSVNTDGGVDTTEALAVEGDRLRFRYEGPGRSENETYPIPEGYRSSLSVFEALKAHAAAGDPLPTELVYESFDSDDKRFEQRTLRLEGVIEDQPFPEGAPGRAYRLVEIDDEGGITRAVVDANYLPLEVEMFDGVLLGVAVAHDPFTVDHYAKITSEIAVDGAVDEWWRLRRMDVVVTVDGDDPERPTLFESNHYQDVQRSGTRYEITLKATRLPESHRAPDLPLQPPAEVTRYLESTALSQSDDPRIRDLAKRLAEGSRDSVKVARNINAFVFTGLEKKSGARGSATATEVLEQRAGDCTEHAALTVALMRAAGIPARNVSGIVYLTDPDGHAVAGYHAWAEVWLGRWVGVDAVFGEMGTSARYLMTGYSEPGEREDDAVGRTLGRIKLSVHAFQRYGQDPVEL